MDRAAAFADIVDRSSKVLHVDDSGGLHPDPAALTGMGARQKLEMFLLGRYLSHAGGLAETDRASDEEIGRFFGMKVHEVQKRAHDLKNLGRIESVEPGVYRVTEGRLSELLRDLGAE